MARKIVRLLLLLLTWYFTIRGWIYYSIHLKGKKNTGVVFYSHALHKDMMHINDFVFLSEYQCTFIGGWYTNKKQIKLTYKDIGLYKFKKK